MPIKKSELYSSLWSSCDELRGGMDASQYKDYVLVLLFIKYISDKYAGVPYANRLSRRRVSWSISTTSAEIRRSQPTCRSGNRNVPPSTRQPQSWFVPTPI